MNVARELRERLGLSSLPLSLPRVYHPRAATVLFDRCGRKERTSAIVLGGENGKLSHRCPGRSSTIVSVSPLAKTFSIKNKQINKNNFFIFQSELHYCRAETSSPLNRQRARAESVELATVKLVTSGRIDTDVARSQPKQEEKGR